jgi:hypothetical protein
LRGNNQADQETKGRDWRKRDERVKGLEREILERKSLYGFVLGFA